MSVAGKKASCMIASVSRSSFCAMSGVLTGVEKPSESANAESYSEIDEVSDWVNSSVARCLADAAS